MSTLLIGIGLVLLFVIAAMLFISLEQKKKKRAASAFLHQVHSFAREHGLEPGKSEMLEHLFLATDRQERALMVFNRRDAAARPLLLPLDEITQMKVVRLHGQAEGGPGAREEKLVTRVDLEMLQKTGAGAAILHRIPFYDHVEHNIYLLSDQEALAESWLAHLKGAGAAIPSETQRKT